MELLENFVSKLPPLAAGILLIAALLQCFLGGRLYRVGAVLICAAMFGSLGWFLAGALEWEESSQLVLTGIGILMGGVLGFLVARSGAVLFCGITGGALGFFLGGISSLSMAVVLGLALTVIFFMDARAFLQPALYLCTGLSGGALAGFALTALLGGNTIRPVLILGGIFALFGVLFQILVGKGSCFGKKG